MRWRWKFFDIFYRVIEAILIFFVVIFSKAVLEPLFNRLLYFGAGVAIMVGLTVAVENTYLKFCFSTISFLSVVMLFNRYYIQIKLPILFELPAAIANGGALIFAIYFPQTLHTNDLVMKTLAKQGLLLYFIGMFIFLMMLIINAAIAFYRGENIN